MVLIRNRSSRPDVFCEKDVSKDFAKCTIKCACTRVSFSPRPETLFKKRPWHRCFPVNFTKLLRTTFFIKHLRWLLLMKLWKLFKLEKKNTMMLKNFNDDFMSVMTPLSFFRFMIDLLESCSRILDAWLIILSLSLIKTFSLTKAVDWSKNLLMQPSHYYLGKRPKYFCLKMLTFCK